MNDNTDAIKKEMARTLDSLSHKVSTLETKARKSLSLEYQIAEHPLLSAGLAFGLGLVVGRQLQTRKTSLEPLAISLVSALVSEVGKKYLPEFGAPPSVEQKGQQTLS